MSTGNDRDPDEELRWAESQPRRDRHDKMVEALEALIREYADVLYDPDDYKDWDPKPEAPDWTNPIAIADLALIVSVEDVGEERARRGYWILHIEPLAQFPYRTRGLLEHVLDEIAGD
jgi:hypothetical protein